MYQSDCPHHLPSPCPGTFRCALVYELYQVDCLPVKLSHPMHPCLKCKDQWDGGPPTKERQTDVVRFYESMKPYPPGQVEFPVDNSIPRPFAHSRIEQGESREVKIRQRPDGCAYMEKVLNFDGCCSMRTWACELHGEVRARDCAKCPDYAGHEAI